MNPYVAYLPESAIESNSSELLSAFARDRGPVTAPPVPVDDIAEKHLRLTIDLTDLWARWQESDVFGALYADDDAIFIDERLDPVEQPEAEVSYRFALAHELGHWCQHRAYFYADTSQEWLSAESEQPSIVCHWSDADARIEYQADCFAAWLLMPTPLVHSAWNDRFGGARLPYLGRAGEPAWGSVVGEFASVFGVPPRVVRGRLADLGLLGCASESGDAFVRDSWL
ncbi:MAG: ImmA/IrrE family metallo-endopeptidase [Anaerolineae bacterium]